MSVSKYLQRIILVTNVDFSAPVRSKKSYHVKDSYQNPIGQSKNENVKSCDFCGIKFGTLGGLRSHIRSMHKEMLPI